MPPYDPTARFRAARDFLLDHAGDHDAAARGFRWPELTEFNWALDWFDAVLAVEHADEPALWIVDGPARSTGEIVLTFAQLAARSDQVAGRLRAAGIGRGDRVLVMLDNQVELWESYLALMKLGAVIVPLAPRLGAAACVQLVDRAAITHVLAGNRHTPKFRHVPGDWAGIVVGAPVEGWLDYRADGPVPEFEPTGRTGADDLLLLFSTPGTTGAPKLVAHTHGSYPAGHLSTMYWVGLRPGDVHLSVSTPGWAKHSCGNIFAPWNAATCVLVCTDPTLTPTDLLALLDTCGVTTMCAPPRAWAALAGVDDLTKWRPDRLRALVTVGDPLNPLVLDRIRQAWQLVVREGYGQSEATAMVGHPPDGPVTFRSLGRPLPGYPVVLVDPVDNVPVPAGTGNVGEICLDLAGPHGRPAPLTTGYIGEPDRNERAFRGRYYHTGDLAVADESGFLTWLGPVEDVFRMDGRWVSPADLELVLAEHAAVAEVGVVGLGVNGSALEPRVVRDPRNRQPWQHAERPLEAKAYVVLRPGAERSAEMAHTILTTAAARMSPYRRVHRLEFVDALPRTPSAKLRRHALRQLPPGQEYRT